MKKKNNKTTQFRVRLNLKIGQTQKDITCGQGELGIFLPSFLAPAGKTVESSPSPSGFGPYQGNLYTGTLNR